MMTRTRLLPIAGVVAVAMIGLLVLASKSKAESTVVSKSFTPSTTQAGGHPDVGVQIEVGNRESQGFGSPCFCDDPRDILSNLPAGVFANPHVAPACAAADFAFGNCPIDSQVGLIAVLIGARPVTDGSGLFFIRPLYNMEPPSDIPGLLQFTELIHKPQMIELRARTGGDFGLTAAAVGLERFSPVNEVLQYFWGVPADPIHDPLRDFQTLCEMEIKQYLDAGEVPPCQPGSPPPPTPSSIPELPFMSNPTACTGPLTSSVTVFSYDQETDHATAPYPEMTGCDQLSFNPSLSAKPTTTEADSASGIDVDLTVPQIQSPSTPSPSQIRHAVTTLPEGFSINPNSADGKTYCSDREASFGTERPAACPEHSKIGTTLIDSSALPEPITGYLYLGTPLPGDRYRMVITAGGYGTFIKLPASIGTDPVTGQVTTRMTDLPQSPLTQFKLHLFGAERGVLATPTRCGSYPVRSTFTPWAAGLPEQSSTQFFTIDAGPGGQPCPEGRRPLNPRVRASSAGNLAGSHSPFGVEVSRSDGDQNLVGLTVTTPPGFAATLRGVAYCSEASIAGLAAGSRSGLQEISSPLCPASSRVGSVVAGAGAGSRPLHVGGDVYLSGPYKGSPLSLVVVIPAVAGPYDLGNVVVRVAVDVDPLTAQVTTKSDPLPQIIGGIPLRTRFVQVELDRPNFTLNPTNCDPLSVSTTVLGDEGSASESLNHYQVANCATLPYRPRLALKMFGGTARRGHPAIRAELTTSPGEANTRRAAVTLPKGQLLDNKHFRTICTRVRFNQRTCPPGSRIGRAEVRTPILDEPLKGYVYLRSSDNQLPDLAVDLGGQLDFTAVARIDSVRGGRLRTTFASVPDVPLGKFILTLEGGKKGLLQNTESLCGTRKRATVSMTGQNGASHRFRSKLDIACGSAAGRGR